MKQLLWGMRNFYLFNKNYLSKTYNVSCLTDVEYMVWKFLYTSCLKACICLYSCVCSVHLFPTTSWSQVNCSHTYALPKPPSSRAILLPLHSQDTDPPHTNGDKQWPCVEDQQAWSAPVQVFQHTARRDPCSTGWYTMQQWGHQWKGTV